MSRRPVPRPIGPVRSTGPTRYSDGPPRWVPWSVAIRSALYGHGGFFHRPEGPAGHFRTSVHASPLFATAVIALLESVDVSLGGPERLDLVDLGAGRGELLVAVLAQLNDPAAYPGLAGRVHLHAVELADRPQGVPEAISWSAELPEGVVGLLVANEWLDNVPVDVVEAGPDGVHRVLVDPADGAESPGGPAGLRDAGWLAQWWPLDGAPEGARAEVGFPRDVAWAGAVHSLERGLAVMIDYGNLRAARVAGEYEAGTLRGYREGRRVPPVPDGTCDLTAHVAVDACAAAGLRAGAVESRLLRQREALQQLGIEGPQAEPRPGTAAALEHASQVAELTAADGLGAFWWLLQSVDGPIPPLARRSV